MSNVLVGKDRGQLSEKKKKERKKGWAKAKQHSVVDVSGGESKD